MKTWNKLYPCCLVLACVVPISSLGYGQSSELPFPFFPVSLP